MQSPWPSAIASWWFRTPGCQRIRSGSLFAWGVRNVSAEKELNLKLARRLRILAEALSDKSEAGLIMRLAAEGLKKAYQ